MFKKPVVITILLLFSVSLGLNAYFMYESSKAEPERDLISVPSSSDEQALLYHSLTMLDALDEIGYSLDGLNAALEQASETDSWQACLIDLNRSLNQLVGAAAQFEETLQLVGQEHPEFVSGASVGFDGTALLIATGDPSPSYEAIFEKINTLAADIAQVQQGDPATLQARLLMLMTEINQAWTITASEMQILHQFYYELSKGLHPGG